MDDDVIWNDQIAIWKLIGNGKKNEFEFYQLWSDPVKNDSHAILIESCVRATIEAVAAALTVLSLCCGYCVCGPSIRMRWK